MNTLLHTKNISQGKENYKVETYLADTIPSVSDCSSVYAFVFKNGEFLQTELRKGERPKRMFDIPGGHIDKDESPEDAVVRETFEETGVIVSVNKIVAYKKVTLMGLKPDNYRYSYPISYMTFYICEVIEETPFEGNEETHGRLWLKFEDFEKSEWCINNKILFEEVIKSLNL